MYSKTIYDVHLSKLPPMVKTEWNSTGQITSIRGVAISALKSLSKAFNFTYIGCIIIFEIWTTFLNWRCFRYTFLDNDVRAFDPTPFGEGATSILLKGVRIYF